MNRPSTNRILLIIWAVLLILVVVGSILPNTSPPGSEFGFDLVLHFGSYAVLACLPIFIFRERKTAVMVALCMAPMGYLVEMIQKNVSGRTFSAEDMIANNLGVFAGIFVGAVIRIRNHYARRQS